MPASLLSSFYGMNLDLPVVKGPVNMFVIIVALSVASAAGMFWYFHRLKWI
jgi:Mg2+ and Co2+ transporter CorA